MLRASLIALALVLQPVAAAGFSTPPAAAASTIPVQAVAVQPAAAATPAAAKRKHSTGALPFGAGSQVVTYSSKRQTHTVNLPKSANKAILQKKVGKYWRTASSMKLTNRGSMKRATFTVTPPKPGKTDSYRIFIYATKTHAAFASKTQRLHFPMQPTSLHTWSVSKNVVVSNRQAEISGFVSGGGRTIELQRQYKGKWLKVASKKTTKHGEYKFLTPKSQATTKYKYRLHAPQYGAYRKATSKIYTLSHENPPHYNGYKKTIYNHIKKRCPNIAIRTAKPNGKWDGLAHMGKNTITVVTGKSGNRLKHISLHECAHMLQDRVYANNYNGLKNRMNKIYKTKGSRGLENNADCIARAIGSPGPYSYNSNCKGYHGTAAKHIINGKRP